MTDQELHQELEAMAPRLVADRRHLHRHPELSGAERETAQFIEQRLTELGLHPELSLDRTAVVADISGGGPGRALLIRADTDALPLQERGEGRDYRSLRAGVMHACGHDGHVAIALATAEVLAQRRSEWAGLVRMVFQPREEVAGGAAPMIAEGVMSSPKIDGVLGLHLWSGHAAGTVGVRDGAIFASADEFALEVRGRGGHGALPHQALDPVPIASLIILGLQTLISRETSPQDAAVITVGTLQAGQAFNVIPETVTLTGTVRAYSDQNRERLLRRIGEVGQGIAAAFSATATMTPGPGCPPVVCEPSMSELVRRAVRATPGAELIAADPLTVGDDVGLFMREAKGCYFLLGAGSAEAGITAPHHHPEFDIDESCLPLGVEVMVRAALDFLGGGAP